MALFDPGSRITTQEIGSDIKSLDIGKPISSEKADIFVKTDDILLKISEVIGKDQFDDEDQMVVPIQKWPMKGRPITAPPKGVWFGIGPEIQILSDVDNSVDSHELIYSLKAPLDFLRDQKAFAIGGGNELLVYGDFQDSTFIPVSSTTETLVDIEFEILLFPDDDAQPDYQFIGFDESDNGQWIGIGFDVTAIPDEDKNYVGNELLVLEYVGNILLERLVACVLTLRNQFTPDGGTNPETGLPTGFFQIFDVKVQKQTIATSKVNVEQYLIDRFKRFEYHLVIIRQKDPDFIGPDPDKPQYSASGITAYRAAIKELEDAVIDLIRPRVNSLVVLDSMTREQWIEDITTKTFAFYPPT